MGRRTERHDERRGAGFQARLYLLRTGPLSLQLRGDVGATQRIPATDQPTAPAAVGSPAVERNRGKVQHATSRCSARSSRSENDGEDRRLPTHSWRFDLWGDPVAGVAGGGGKS